VLTNLIESSPNIELKGVQLKKNGKRGQRGQRRKILLIFDT